MKRLILFVLAGILLLALAACSSTGPACKSCKNTESKTESMEHTEEPEAEMAVYQIISPQDAKMLLDGGKNVILVDVRRTDEYEEKHIPSAIHIPNEEIGNTRPKELPDQKATILVYCRSGRRSKEAVEKLIQLGYTDVRDLGGIADWPYDTVSGSEPGTWMTGKAA